MQLPRLIYNSRAPPTLPAEYEIYVNIITTVSTIKKSSLSRNPRSGILERLIIGGDVDILRQNSNKFSKNFHISQLNEQRLLKNFKSLHKASLLEAKHIGDNDQNIHLLLSSLNSLNLDSAMTKSMLLKEINLLTLIIETHDTYLFVKMLLDNLNQNINKILV